PPHAVGGEDRTDRALHRSSDAAGRASLSLRSPSGGWQAPGERLQFPRGDGVGRPGGDILAGPIAPLHDRARLPTQGFCRPRHPEYQGPEMIVDVHTHFFRPDRDFGPALRADMARCGVDPASWGDVGEQHLLTTRRADVAVVFGLRAEATGWNIPNEAVAAH